MVSSNEAGFDLRESSPLPRNILHRWRTSPTDTGLASEPEGSVHSNRLPRLVGNDYQSKGFIRNLSYSDDARDSAKSGLGHIDNRHLHHLVEFISVNVGGPCQGVKPSSPAIPDKGVGGSIVVGGWESQPHGEGSQKFDTPLYLLAASSENSGQSCSTTGCEREEDDNAEGNLSSEMPNFGEPCAVKVACTVRRGE